MFPVSDGAKPRAQEGVAPDLVESTRTKWDCAQKRAPTQCVEALSIRLQTQLSEIETGRNEDLVYDVGDTIWCGEIGVDDEDHVRTNHNVTSIAD